MAKRVEIKTKLTKTGCHEVISHQWSDRFGYCRTKRKLGGIKYNLMHRYVFALNFGHPSSDLCVCHKCDNPKCINPDHLFLGTLADNNADRSRKGRSSRKSKTNGEINGMSKLNKLQVSEIRRLSGLLSQSRIAKMFGISQSQVSGIQRKLYWKHFEVSI